MNKNAIQKFAVWARVQLIGAVKQRAFAYEITGGGDRPELDAAGGRLLTNAEKSQRRELIGEIRRKGFDQVMEEAAYTWFNRFIALRFMEVNNYLPSKVRLFTDENGAFKPQILKEAMTVELDGLDRGIVLGLLDKQENEALYKYLLITQCNALNAALPGMFEKIANWTELLFPDNLLRSDNVLGRMISDIPEEDWKDAVQIIGWLYQYYNSEKKDDVFAALKKNVKITKENIPAATQLFTPDWIVRYMVENSLGRLWLEGHPDVKEQLLPTEEEQSAYAAGNRDPEDTKWHYYLEEAEQEPEVQAQLAEIRKEYAALTPDQLKVIDPCSGSGHILAYMFDVLMKIYESYGYTTREAVASIVENNLYGLDIDDRAAQLAYFAVMMKARQYDRRFFSRGIQPHVYAIVESNHVDKFAVDYFCNGDMKLTTAMDTIIKELHDAKEYGSILTVTPQDWSALYDRFAEITEDINMSRETALRELLPLVQVAEALAQKYDVVVTNPPYMGASNMNLKLNEFIKNNYADYKSDFFSAFVIHASQMTKQSGYCGFFTPYVWMFIQSYEKMRNYLYNQATIETLIQFEYSAFEEATVPVCTFAFQNRHVQKKGCYLRLVDFRGGMEVQRQKTLEAIKNHDCGFYYEQNTDNFSIIPGSPVAYWASTKMLESFQTGNKFAGETKKGVLTGDNNTYLRLWHEVNIGKIGFELYSHAEMIDSSMKWFPVTSGGEKRRWYGNFDTIVNLENDGADIKANVKNYRLRDSQYYMLEAITWTEISSSIFTCRYVPKGILFGNGGPVSFFFNKKLMYHLALLNSKVAMEILGYLAPTINYGPEQINRIPIVYSNEDEVNQLTKWNILLSQTDWDSFETSWDFQHHPLLRKVPTIAEAFDQWQAECDDRFNQLKANEEELNRIFIDIYGLQDELIPEVEDKDVTVRKADLGRDIRSFISYAVGCMFGRYSLDVDGLAYAGGEWDASKYASFAADKDNIIPICDDEYFEDDIVGLFVEFVKTVYGADTLDENLKFIADALGGKGQPKDVIRNYFLSDFYSDHCKIYQKRPIYWLFDSGKKNGFKALIYMHRYQPDTIARIRTDYVHEQQARYRTAIVDLEQRIANASAGERVKLNKKLTTLQAQDTEIRTYEEKIHHLADQMISIDLDDGVKKNYAIFQDVLAKIK